MRNKNINNSNNYKVTTTIYIILEQTYNGFNYITNKSK